MVEVLYPTGCYSRVYAYAIDATRFYASHAGVPLGVLMGVANVSCKQDVCTRFAYIWKMKGRPVEALNQSNECGDWWFFRWKERIMVTQTDVTLNARPTLALCFASFFKGTGISSNQSLLRLYAQITTFFCKIALPSRTLIDPHHVQCWYKHQNDGLTMLNTVLKTIIMVDVARWFQFSQSFSTMYKNTMFACKASAQRLQ